MTDLISKAAGGRVVEFNDQFFAEADNLISVTDPVWKEGLYTGRGKWMDGWETRRRRDPGYDWCVLALGLPGRIDRVTVDTSHFTGNYPEQFSLEACGVGEDDRLDDGEWVELIGSTHLKGDSVASFDVDDRHRVTHVRLNIYPDGGVARLRVTGEPIPAMGKVCPEMPVDLVSGAVGGIALDASDVHYSQPSNLLRTTSPAGMWDGWETRRRRGPGHDWATFRLGLAGVVERLEVDTSYFKGNSPGWVSADFSDDGESWTTVLDHVAVEPDSINVIELEPPAQARYVMLSIHPDGGVARLHVLGRPDQEAAGEKRIEYLDALFDQQARRFFHSACASSSWVDDMEKGRPYESVSSVLESAVSAFDGLLEGDWMEAFAGHPRIGERGDEVSAREQSDAAGASDSVNEELAKINREYEDKFGFIYIVYATGKNAPEMLEIARSRLLNTREEEMRNAAEQQRLITETRLRSMLCQETS